MNREPGVNSGGREPFEVPALTEMREGYMPPHPDEPPVAHEGGCPRTWLPRIMDVVGWLLFP